MHRFSVAGKSIREVRKELGLTQVELAYKLGVTRQTVMRWENETHSPYPYNAELIETLTKSPAGNAITD